MGLLEPVDRLAGMTSLDTAARPLRVVAGLIPRHWRDLLHGTWLGHPVHPALAYVPLGSWIGAAILDVAALTPSGRERRASLEDAATTLVTTGVAAAPLAALAGAADWDDLHADQQRIGFVHAAANATAVVVLLGSLGARRSGRHGLGRVLGLLGTGVAGASAGIGGHLAFRWAAGPHHAEHVPHRTADGWHQIGGIEEFPDGGLWRREVGGTPVVVLRRGDEIRVLADMCSHLAGPLSQGDLVQQDGEDCVRCPWHGSTFRFSDGKVVTGPATAPQPVFEVRVEGRAVSARVRRTPPVPAGRR